MVLKNTVLFSDAFPKVRKTKFSNKIVKHLLQSRFHWKYKTDTVPTQVQVHKMYSASTAKEQQRYSSSTVTMQEKYSTSACTEHSTEYETEGWANWSARDTLLSS